MRIFKLAVHCFESAKKTHFCWFTGNIIAVGTNATRAPLFIPDLSLEIHGEWTLSRANRIFYGRPTGTTGWKLLIAYLKLRPSFSDKLRIQRNKLPKCLRKQLSTGHYHFGESGRGGRAVRLIQTSPLCFWQRWRLLLEEPFGGVKPPPYPVTRPV